MALSGAELKAKMKTSIRAGLVREFGNGATNTPENAVQWGRIADALSDVAYDIVNVIINEAQVVPIMTSAKKEATGPTVQPVLGKII